MIIMIMNKMRRLVLTAVYCTKMTVKNIGGHLKKILEDMEKGMP